MSGLSALFYKEMLRFRRRGFSPDSRPQSRLKPLPQAPAGSHGFCGWPLPVTSINEFHKA
ncbi:MAG: hypothetical protein QG662_187 [Pseudomonadota bacterium]|nr:hypothetical protein [Pseudomonadota bacterium]